MRPLRDLPERPSAFGEGWERRAFPVGVLVATALGMALRAWHLGIPLRYDEAVTFLDYASSGFVHAVTTYPTPNNHVLNTVLIEGLTSVLGPEPFAIRLPAFVSGTLLVPAVAWMALRRYGPRVAVFAAFLVAGAPVLVEFSANGRGYSLIALATVAAVAVGEEVLREPRAARWLALGALGVAGLWTVPVMLLPWAGITVWLWVNLWIRDGSLRARLRREMPLVMTQLGVALLVVALYLPIALTEGVNALLDNRFVTPLDWEAFAGALPTAITAVTAHWARALPGPLAALLAVGVVAALALRPRRHRRRGDRFPLGWSLLIGVVAVMLAKRNPGEARIWLWALPLVLTTAAAGITALLERTLRPALAARTTAGVAAAWFVLVAAHLVLDRPLRRSLETGGFMEVESVAEWLAERLEPADAVVTDFESREPLRFYLVRHGADPNQLRRPPGPGGRAWVVLNFNEDDRPPRAAERAASLGIRLGGANPMATFGPVEIYGFGSPTAEDGGT